MDAKNLADRYNLPELAWEPIEIRLDQEITQGPGTGGPDRHTWWLGTINPDGSPHVTGVGGFWQNGELWFTSGDQTRKTKNLARDPRCTASIATHDFDLVIDGEAELIDDPAAVANMAKEAAAGGWPASVDESGTALTAEYSAPSAGPPPWRVYRLVPKAATAVATIEPGGATRWTF